MDQRGPPEHVSRDDDWPATGFVDTWFRAMMLDEVADEATSIQPRVQARGGATGRERGVSSALVAKELGIGANVVSRWVREASGDIRKVFPGQGQQSAHL